MSLPFPRRSRIEVEDVGDVTIVGFVDRKMLDGDNPGPLGEDLYRLVDGRGRRKVLLNFGNVEFWSSAVLGKLITLYRRLQAVRGRLVLCNVPPDMSDVFKITKLDRILTVVTVPGLVGQDEVTREVFGNLSRPVVVSPEWRTDTVLALARGMRRSRDFYAMPILADALQDAGCDDDELLAHCRGPRPHVRGCWVVDLVVGTA